MYLLIPHLTTTCMAHRTNTGDAEERGRWRWGHAELLRASTRVVSLDTVLVEEEGGERADLKSVAGVVFVGGGVELGDDNLVVVSEGFGDLLVVGLQGSAVTAPGGVDHDEGVLVLVVGNFFVVGGGEFDDTGGDQGGNSEEDGDDEGEGEGTHDVSFKRFLIELN